MMKRRNLHFVPMIQKCSIILAIILVVSAAFRQTGGADLAVEDTWQALLKLAREERLKQEAAHRAAVEEAGLELDPWYCAGPFKDRPLGIHIQSFNYTFGPEEQALAAGARPIDLRRTWEVERLPGMLDNTRRWVRHAEWTDGYRHELPMGPPPGWNETMYLYRTISTRKSVSVDMEIHAEDDVRAWINGNEVGEAYATGTSSRFPACLRAKLDLNAGDNRLLIKITCMHGSRGFAFAIPMVTPYNELRPDQMEGRGNPWSNDSNVVQNKFYPGNEPYSSGGRSAASDVEARYRSYREKKNGISTTARPRALYDSYAKGLFNALELPDEAYTLLPPAKNRAGVQVVRELYYRACRYTDALARVREFRFDVPVAPMYDPPTLKMQEVLDAKVLSTPGGQAYVDRLDVLKRRARAALADAEDAQPSAFESIVRASDEIERMWADVIGSLEPIAFVTSPDYDVNAIAPYTSEGAGPASICLFDPSRPNEPPRVIYHDPDGAIFDMNVSYDAKTIFFSTKPRSDVRGAWDIYEIGVDGTGLRRITYGDTGLNMGSAEDPYIDSNISPVELPSGEIMFVSTRDATYVNCQSEPSGHLYVANRDGSNVRRVSGNTHSDHTPQVMNDGRVLFSRWDYGVDKNVFLRQSLWAMNPDGTRLQLFSGNTIENPNSFWEARPIPDRPEVVCVFGPHHEFHAGMIGTLWNHLGFEVPRGTGFRWITQELPLVDDVMLGWSYQDPYPINERLFLVSYGGDGEGLNRIYLLDDRGNKKCVYEDPELGCWDPILLRPRTRPPAIEPASHHTEFVYRDPALENQNPNHRWGTFVLQDVYEGLHPHIKRGEIKSLAIMEQLPKTSYPLGHDIWGYSPTIGRGTMFVRRLVGTVPVEEDGSAQFLAPAVKDISINALDAEGRLLMKMGATTHIMPGEVVSCIGCHEDRFMAPPANSRVPLAAQREPSVPVQPDWGTNGIIDFVKVVQPVLDKHCVECHSGPRPAAYVDLSDDKTRLFNMGYNQLLDRGMIDYAPMNGTDHGETTPKAVGSLLSRIREKIETDHSGQVLPLADRQRIYAWIDSGVPYYGTYSFTNTYTGGGRDRWYMSDRNGWFNKDFVPSFKRRCLNCHSRKVNRQTYNYGPRRPEQTVTVTSTLWDNYALMTPGFSAISTYGPMHRVNLTNPEWSQMLTAPLAEDAGGLGLCRDANGNPYIFRDKNDPDYRAMLKAITKGHRALIADPRVDMIAEIRPETLKWPLY